MKPSDPVVIHLPGPSLVSAGAGLEHAAAVLAALARVGRVQLDATAAERMTPSFANALVMSILDAIGQSDFERRVELVGGPENLRENWNKAVDRYGRGIRLSTQRPRAA
ncbi:MAG: hypothetical protein ACKVS8_09165 [Phycisphaerales bacterium]